MTTTDLSQIFILYKCQEKKYEDTLIFRGFLNTLDILIDKFYIIYMDKLESKCWKKEVYNVFIETNKLLIDNGEIFNQKILSN